MAEPTPIKPGVAPVFDSERELVDFFITQMRAFTSKHGLAPSTIAMAFTAEDAGAFKTGAYSWALDDKSTRLQICSVAATLMHKRALSAHEEVS